MFTKFCKVINDPRLWAYHESSRFSAYICVSILANHINQCSSPTCGRPGSIVPFIFAVSGAPSPFLLLSGSLVISVECFVSEFDSPSCLPDCEVVIPPGDFAAAGLTKFQQIASSERSWCILPSLWDLHQHFWIHHRQRPPVDYRNDSRFAFYCHP